MILHDEQHFKGLANVFQPPIKPVMMHQLADVRSLPQILQSLKAAA
jgi:hypothetical protein